MAADASRLSRLNAHSLDLQTMYEPGPHDRVVLIQAVPQPDVGAPLPALVATEHDIHVVYVADERSPAFDGTSVRVVSHDTDGLSVVHLEFERPYCHYFGPPNDEALHGHPLASRGLEPYAVQQVAPSGWIHALERMNSVHPHHRASAFASLRHFILAFHDSMLECVAHGFTVSVSRGSVASALCQVALAASNAAVEPGLQRPPPSRRR